MVDPSSLSATEASQLMKKGLLTSVKLVESCLSRISMRDPAVQAWQVVDEEGALAAARKCDADERRGPLHGIPVGMKDIIDTCDIMTAYGSPIYKDNQPSSDSACVALTREAGGIILGKTVSTEFATRHPGKTRNPHNLDHTPGGSSSGSAAAVADFMVPLALGTQTTGSVIRPSAYCGVVGYKPSFGYVNRTGVKPLSDSLDTIGFHARSVADIGLYFSVLSGRTPVDFEGEQSRIQAWRIGYCRTPMWDRADAETHALLENAAGRLTNAGAEVAEIVLDPAFEKGTASQAIIAEFETWRALAFERTQHPDKLSPALTERLERAGNRSVPDYENARLHAEECRRKIAAIFKDWDALLVPAAPGSAPEGLAYTGDPVFSQLWTLLQGPAITIPAGASGNGMPLAVQLIGNYRKDEDLLRCANWAEMILRDQNLS